MAVVTTSVLSFEEFERLPDQPGKQELLQGELIELPPPELIHSKIARRLFKRLDSAVEASHSRGEATEVGDVYFETGYKLSDASYVIPDLSLNHASQPEARYLSGAPAIAIEVISPSNTAHAIDLKTKLYFEFGAREVWIAHPEARYFTIYTSNTWRRLGEKDALTTPLLPGFSLPVREIFE